MGDEMLKYILLEESEEKVTYEYFPEGGSDSGVVSFYDGEFSIDSLAENDKHQIYAMKALQRIRRMAKW